MTPVGDPGISYAPVGLLPAIVVVFLGWSFSARWRSAARERSWFSPPPLQTAAVLIALAAVDWLVTAFVLFVLLPPALPFSYLLFVSVYLMAQAIGMLSHVPGGAGVFEATILSVLAPAADSEIRAGLVASLIVYRLVLLSRPARRRNPGRRRDRGPALASVIGLVQCPTGAGSFGRADCNGRRRAGAVRATCARRSG